MDYLRTSFFLGCAVCLGLVIDRALNLRLNRLGAARWPGFALATWIFVHFYTLHPALALGVGVALAAYSRWSMQATSEVASFESKKLVALCLAVLFCILATRAPEPLYWDESAWLGRAKLGADHWQDLKAAMLDPFFKMFGEGHPFFWPLGIAALAGRPSSHSLVVASQFALFVPLSFFVCLAFRHFSRRVGDRWWGLIAPAGLVLVPFVFLHLRMAYADLSVGLLGGALALLLAETLARRAKGEPAGDPAPIVLVVAACLTALKDDGIPVALAAAATCLFASLRHGEWRIVRVAVPVVVFALLPVLVWKLFLGAHGIANEERALTGIRPATLWPIAYSGLLRYAVDIRTWGIFWGLVAGALASVPLARHRVSESTKIFASFVALHAGALYAALALSPDLVIRYVTVEGHLTNRLLLQIAPCALVLLVSFARDLLRSEGPQSRKS